MNVSGNKRYVETDERIQNAFLFLLEKKEINGITVNDICRSAQISRPSFYSHYDDINDLIHHIESKKSAYIGDILTASSPLSIHDFIKYVHYIKENKSFYLAYFKCEAASPVSNFMMEKYLSANRKSSTPSLRYQMLFFMAGLKAVLLDWLEHNCIESVEQIAHILLQQYSLFSS